MKLLQAYKFELMPNGEQMRSMRQYAGSCRFVYNKALAWQNEQYTADNSFKFSYTKIANLLPEWKKCVECGHSENADINEARNILAAGHAVLADNVVNHAI